MTFSFSDLVQSLCRYNDSKDDVCSNNKVNTTKSKVEDELDEDEQDDLDQEENAKLCGLMAAAIVYKNSN